MASEGDGEGKKLDRFELCMALMLGIGAMGAAWAGFQGDLWGGIQAESYGLASKEMARAASTMSLAAAKMGEASTAVTGATSGVSQILATNSYNANLDLQAKEHLFEGIVGRDMHLAAGEGAPAETTKHFYIAKYLYAVQMDEAYFEAMGFPAEYRGPDKFEAMPDEVLIEHGSKSMPSSVVDKALEEPAAAMEVAATAYEEVVAAQTEAVRMQTEADARFSDGSKANSNGDNLGFTGVLFTAALFLAGVGLVFKSRVKWGFASVGFVALLAAVIHLFMREWTSF